MSNQEQKKPSYLDENWTALIKDRLEKWDRMLCDFRNQGINKVSMEKESKILEIETDRDTPGLIIYPIHVGTPRGMIIICPGGGFMFKSANEGKEVADYFYEKGFNIAILDYTVNRELAENLYEAQKSHVYDLACRDGLRAIQYFRYRAKEWNILPDKIAIGGFSAGGMVTSMVLANYTEGKSDAVDPIEHMSSRPDAVFQMYGSFRGRIRKNEEGVLGYTYKSARQAAEDDVILHFPMDLPPAFLAQTDEDDPRNVLEMAGAFRNRGVPAEVHIFKGGPHGGALFDGKHEDSPNFPHTAHWAELAAEWFAMQGF